MTQATRTSSSVVNFWGKGKIYSHSLRIFEKNLARRSASHLLVLQHLAGLHGAHDGGVNGVLAVLVHVLHHLPPLLLRRRRDLHSHTTMNSSRQYAIS